MIVFYIYSENKPNEKSKTNNYLISMCIDLLKI